MAFLLFSLLFFFLGHGLEESDEWRFDSITYNLYSSFNYSPFPLFWYCLFVHRVIPLCLSLPVWLYGCFFCRVLFDVPYLSLPAIYPYVFHCISFSPQQIDWSVYGNRFLLHAARDLLKVFAKSQSYQKWFETEKELPKIPRRRGNSERIINPWHGFYWRWRNKRDGSYLTEPFKSFYAWIDAWLDWYGTRHMRIRILHVTYVRMDLAKIGWMETASWIHCKVSIGMNEFVKQHVRWGLCLCLCYLCMMIYLAYLEDTWYLTEVYAR